jgi:hypothetical protein
MYCSDIFVFNGLPPNGRCNGFAVFTKAVDHQTLFCVNRARPVPKMPFVELVPCTMGDNAFIFFNSIAAYRTSSKMCSPPLAV